MSEIEGKALKANGEPIDWVILYDWDTGDCLGKSKPNELGDWAFTHHTNLKCGITYVAHGCEPISHGPYEFEGGDDEHLDKVVLLMYFDNNIVDNTNNDEYMIVNNINFERGLYNNAINLTPYDSNSSNGLLSTKLGNDLYSFGVFDFTIELWIKPSNVQLQLSQSLISLFHTHSFAGWQLYLYNLKPVFYKYDNGGNDIIIALDSISYSEWHHIAICRNNKITSMFIDGIKISSAEDFSNYVSTNIKMSIGYQEYGNARYPYNGLIDNIRITKGIARYNNNFGLKDINY